MKFEFHQKLRVKAQRIHQALAQQLGTAILTGKVQPGEALPGELEHSDRLRVSRTAYREAVRMLVAKGLVESRPKAGTRVTQRDRWHMLDPDILAWMFSGDPNEDFIRDLFELRGIIEPAAAELAALRRSDAQLAAMKSALSEMARFGLAREEGRIADRLFHRHIMEATCNEALTSLAGSVGAAVQWTTQFKQRVRQLPRDPVPEHEALYQAIAKQDVGEARRAMLELLRLALADMEIRM